MTASGRRPRSIESLHWPADSGRGSPIFTASLDAYALYLRGLAKYYQFGNRQTNDEALRLFNGAIELDPDFASAYSRAALCYASAKANSYFPITPNEIAEMTRLAQRAVELGKDDAIALATGGYALMYVALDLGVGATLIDRALVLNSNLAEAWSNGGWAKNWLGEPELAIERFARAMRLSPVDPTVGAYAKRDRVCTFPPGPL